MGVDPAEVAAQGAAEAAAHRRGGGSEVEAAGAVDPTVGAADLAAGGADPVAAAAHRAQGVVSIIYLINRVAAKNTSKNMLFPV